MTKYCSKCKAKFECKADQIDTCHCSKIDIPPSKIKVLNQEYNDCLCADCLAELVFKAN